MKPVIIFGAEDLARLACYYLLNDTAYSVRAFTVHQQFLDKPELMGLPVIAFESIDTVYPPDKYAMLIAIGYRGVNEARANIFEACKGKGYELISYISPKAIVRDDLTIGENCLIHAGANIGPFVTVGNNAVINPGVHIAHDTRVGDHCFFGTGSVVNGDCNIGDFCLIGSNATIADGIAIGNACVVGTGITITKDLNPSEVFLPREPAVSTVNSEQLSRLQFAQLKADTFDNNTHTPFALTPIQQAYWVGRSSAMPLGGVTCHYYAEIELHAIDLERLTVAWQILVKRHAALRTVITTDGKQQVLPEVPPYEIQVFDLTMHALQTQTKKSDALRAEMSHQCLPSDHWPLFDIRAMKASGERTLLFVSFDALVIDGRSRILLLREWQDLYEHPDKPLPPLHGTFHDFIRQQQERMLSKAHQHDLTYWHERLKTMPPSPLLPLTRNAANIRQSRFTRYEARLEPELWDALRTVSTSKGLRPTVVILTAFAQTLRLWSDSSDMTLNLTIVDRLARAPEFKPVAGEYTSSLLFALSTDWGTDFETSAHAVQRQLIIDLEHSGVSGVEVIREQMQQSGSRHQQLMPVVFTGAHTADRKRGGNSPTGWLGRTVFALTQTPQVYLDYQTHEEEGAFIAVWDVVDAVFPEGMPKAMLTSHLTLLRQLASEPTFWNANARMCAALQLPPHDKQLYAFLNSTSHSTEPKRVYDGFLRHASSTPDRTALITPTRRLSYGELDQASAAIALQLRQNGIAAHEPVAVVMEKGWEPVAAVLAVSRSGTAFLPLDPAMPDIRLQQTLEHAGVRLVLTQSCFAQTIPWPASVTCLTVGNSICGTDDLPTNLSERPADLSRPDDMAYLIYTSGSTGTPKGVMITHRACMNTVDDITERFKITSDDRLLMVSPFSFDLAVFDIFGILNAGGSIVIPENEAAKDPSRWLQLLKQHQVTIWNSVPALMMLLCDYAETGNVSFGESLRLVLLSGDHIPKAVPKRVYTLAPGAKVISLGGATEASIWSIFHPIEPTGDIDERIPYGTPLHNQTIYILDETLALRPSMVPGEIYIGGAGLAMGYLNDPELTARHFIRHPDTQERLYKTGDIGRMRSDGLIDILGRKDHQVQISGFRVELGEIETIMQRHPDVKRCIAVAQESNGQKTGVTAFLQPQGDTSGLEERLRSFAQEHLPAYMRPATLIFRTSFPLSTNGKIDRKALVLSSATAAAEPTISCEINSAAVSILELVSDVLGTAVHDPDERIVNLGASSIDIIRIINRIEQSFGVRPSIDEFYADGSARSLASLIETKNGSHAQSVSAQTEADEPEAVVDADALILDPVEREHFRKKRAGIRRDLNQQTRIALSHTDQDTPLSAVRHGRRSHRHFASTSLDIAGISTILNALCNTEHSDGRHFSYGSAGGLYPVQTYVYAKPGRIESIAGGYYYLHPEEHTLIALETGTDLPATAYSPLVNRPILAEAAFAIFFIADLAAIAPMYGEQSLHYATIEAGLMTQLLEESAPIKGIGLCQIGELEFNLIRPHFKLNEKHVLVHSLLGGGIDPHV